MSVTGVQETFSEVPAPEQQRLHEPREMWSETEDREYYGDQNEAGSIFFSFFGLRTCPNTQRHALCLLALALCSSPASTLS